MLVASRCAPVVYHGVGVKMEPVTVDKVISSEKGKHLLVIKGYKFRFQKFLRTVWNDGVVLTINVNVT